MKGVCEISQENDISKEMGTSDAVQPSISTHIENNNTFNRLKELQDLINKESGLRGLCKE